MIDPYWSEEELSDTIDRLVLLAFSDEVQSMESDPVEPEIELEFVGGFSDGIAHVPPTHTGGSSD